jgi:hypothetical protein
MLAVGSANAAVTFIGLGVDAKGDATAKFKTNATNVTASQDKAGSTTDLNTAITGVARVATPMASSPPSSNSANSVSSSASETVSASTTDASDASITFSSTTRVKIGKHPLAGDLGTAGDAGSSAYYAFSVTPGYELTVDWTGGTVASNGNAEPYTVQVFNYNNPADALTSITVAANDASDSYTWDLPAGSWEVLITSSAGTFAPDYLTSSVSGTVTGSSNAPFSIAVTSVPELSTWPMLALGFAGLGFMGRRATRQRVSIV